MRKICTKRLGLGFPTQAAPHKSRRDLPTLTLTTSRPNCGLGFPAPFGRASLRGNKESREDICAPSLPPHNRGSLAGARAPPPLLRRVRRREWFSCCSWLLLSASRCARIVAGPGRLGSPPSLFAFLACVLRACGCLPALELGAYRFGLPVSRPLSQARSLARRGLSAPAGLPSRAPSPAAALLVGRVGFPPCRSARSARPLALLPRHSGLPLRGCFCPAVAGLVSFSPFRPPPASSLRCGCVLRASRGTRSLVWRSLVCVPSPPI